MFQAQCRGWHPAVPKSPAQNERGRGRSYLLFHGIIDHAAQLADDLHALLIVLQICGKRCDHIAAAIGQGEHAHIVLQTNQFTGFVGHQNRAFLHTLLSSSDA